MSHFPKAGWRRWRRGDPVTVTATYGGMQAEPRARGIRFHLGLIKAREVTEEEKDEGASGLPEGRPRLGPPSTASASLIARQHPEPRMRFNSLPSSLMGGDAHSEQSRCSSPLQEAIGSPTTEGGRTHEKVL